jgi:hypothetical protein
MKHIFLSFTLIFIVLLASCAHPRSNTRSAKDEKLHLIVFEDRDDDIRVSGVEALAIAAGVELAAKAARFLIEQEAKKYHAIASRSLNISLPVNESYYQGTLTNSTYFVFIRTVEGEKRLLPQMSENIVSRISENIASALNKAGSSVTTNRVQKLLADAELSDSSRAFTLCLLAEMQPVPDEKAFVINILGYAYPGMKAKRSRVPVPFTRIHRVNSTFKVTVDAPAGFGARLGSGYSESEMFKLRLEDSNDSAKDFNWREDSKNIRALHSKLFWVPPTKNFTLTVSIIESSDMPKMLNSLGAQVGKIKYSDMR